MVSVWEVLLVSTGDIMFVNCAHRGIKDLPKGVARGQETHSKLEIDKNLCLFAGADLSGVEAADFLLSSQRIVASAAPKTDVARRPTRGYSVCE